MMKVFKYDEKTPEERRIEKEKSDGRVDEGKRSSTILLSRPSCGCGCVPPAKEK